MRKIDTKKRILSLCLGFVAAFNIFQSAAFAAIDVLYTDFSAEELPGWTLSGGVVTGGAMKIPPSSTTDWQTWKLPKPYKKGNVVVEYDLMSESDRVQLFIQNPNGGSVCRVRLMNLNKIELQHGGSTGKEVSVITASQYTPGTWYHFKHVINYRAVGGAVSSVYVYDRAGSFIGSAENKLYMESDKYASPTELRSILVQNTGSGGDTYIDNIAVYENAGVYVEGLSYAAEGDSVNVSGTVEGMEDAVVISAIYDNNILKSVCLGDGNFKMSHENIDFHGYTAKLFVMDSAESMTPVANAVCTDEKEIKTYSTIADRARLFVESYRKKPFPDPEGDTDVQIGEIGYALSLLYLGEDTEKANNLLLSCLEGCDATLGENSGIYFQMSILLRIYNIYNSSLTEQVKEKIEEFFLKYLDIFSDTAVAVGEFAHGNDVFLIEGTGNHHVIRRLANLLGAQLLKKSDKYKDYVLSDGKTAAEHYDAWLGYWMREIPFRIKTAPEIEYFSSGYSKYTLDVFLTLYDCTEDEILKELCRKYLDYLTAEMTVLSTNGIFGGARGRSVRTNDNSQLSDFFLNMIYFNHNSSWRLNGSFDVVTGEILNTTNNQTCHPNLMSLATSSYRPPYILTNIALAEKEPYEYVSYPSGRGERYSGKSGYFTIVQPSRYMRYSYVTPDYTVGSMTYDRALSYTEIQQQNRYVGLHFKNSGNNGQLLRVFPDTEREYSRGFNDINAAASGSAMVVCSLPEAKYYNPEINRDIKIGVSKQFYKNHVFKNGWFFAQTDDGNGYVAVKPSRGEISGFEDEGKDISYLLFNEVNVPIVMQAGSRSEHGSLEAFMDKVNKAEFVWESEKAFSYTPAGVGEKITYYTDNSVHRTGNAELELESIFTVKSPYLTSVRGSGAVYIKDTHNSSIVLDFNLEG